MIERTSMQRRNTGESGGILAWLAISFLLISACFVMAGIFFVHHIKVSEFRAGKEVQVETPSVRSTCSQDGGSRAGTVGMAIYPGAKLIRDHDSATVDLSSIFGEGDLHIVAGKWETPDPIDKVQKYYEDKFPDMSVVQHTGRVEMHSINGHGKRVIVLRDRRGSTEISLASVGEPKAN